MSIWITWLAFSLLVHHYLIYPAAVILLAHMRSRDADGFSALPLRLLRVSLIVAAYNEEKVIGHKIENSLAIDYPPELMEVIVVSDGSSDSTPSIVAQYANRRVVSIHESARRGKTAALNRGVPVAKGEIVLFSDANNDFNPGAVRALVRNFADPTVGGVCGIKRIREHEERDSSEGDSLYWRYESAIKLAESRLGTITNGDGEIFAIRRALYEPMDESVINDDAELTLQLVQKGYRVLYEPGAQSHEFASIEIADDFFVKVRMVAGGFQTVMRHAGFLLPPRNWFSFAFFSHKILRWTSPLWLVALLIANMFASLSGNHFYETLLAMQFVFYVLAIAGWAARVRSTLPTIFYVPFYFCTMNIAAFFGMLRFLRRTQQVQWRKAKR